VFPALSIEGHGIEVTVQEQGFGSIAGDSGQQIRLRGIHRETIGPDPEIRQRLLEEVDGPTRFSRRILGVHP